MLASLLGLALATTPSATLWYQAGETGAVGKLSEVFDVEGGLSGSGYTPLANGAQLDCVATDGVMRVSLTLEPPIDWAEIPDVAACAIGDQSWIVQLDTEPPAQGADLAIRATLDGGDLHISGDSQIATVQIEIRVGTVAWAQPLESLVGTTMRVPLALPDEPPTDDLGAGIDHPLEVTIRPMDGQGIPGEPVVLRGTVRWTDRGPDVSSG